MKIAIISVLIAYFIPYACVILAKSGPKGCSNRTPRLSLDKLEGWRQRAHWAQINNFENFAPYAFAVLAGMVLQVDPLMLGRLAMGFVVFRILHALCYILNASTLRTLVWFGAQVCVVWLFILSLQAAAS